MERGRIYRGCWEELRGVGEPWIRVGWNMGPLLLTYLLCCFVLRMSSHGIASSSPSVVYCRLSTMKLRLTSTIIILTTTTYTVIFNILLLQRMKIASTLLYKHSLQFHWAIMKVIAGDEEESRAVIATGRWWPCLLSSFVRPNYCSARSWRNTEQW